MPHSQIRVGKQKVEFFSKLTRQADVSGRHLRNVGNYQTTRRNILGSSSKLLFSCLGFYLKTLSHSEKSTAPGE
jgi:hypothetical protein